MIRLTGKAGTAGPVDALLTLPLESRIKSRQRVTLDNGREAGIFLQRGAKLKDGDQLCAEDGYRVQIKAAEEALSMVISDDSHLLSRACYHLGNRHVMVQIGKDRVSYLHDHVLDQMLRGLGLEVIVTSAPFEPEPGAYGGSAHRHSHGHDHDHGQRRG